MCGINQNKKAALQKLGPIWTLFFLIHVTVRSESIQQGVISDELALTRHWNICIRNNDALRSAIKPLI